MRILSIGNFLNPSWDGSLPDEEHIASALESFRHQVIRHQREDKEFSLHGQRPDLILIAQWDGYPPQLLKRLKRLYECPAVYWAFDHQAWGQEWHESLIEQSDLYLSKRIADSKYPNWQWLSQDFAPEFLDRYPGKVEKDIDVLFTGSYLPWATERNEILKAVDDKFNLVIHSVTPDAWRGQGFKDVRPPLMDAALPGLYRWAKINLSIDHTIEAGYWSDRNAQIMACGGLVLFKYVPLSEYTFKDHIVYFKDLEDCLYRIPQLLERPDEDINNVTDGAYEYAHNYLMVGNRVRDLLTIVENTIL